MCIGFLWIEISIVGAIVIAITLALRYILTDRVLGEPIKNTTRSKNRILEICCISPTVAYLSYTRNGICTVIMQPATDSQGYIIKILELLVYCNSLIVFKS